jgi:hypothetical protein
MEAKLYLVSSKLLVFYPSFPVTKEQNFIVYATIRENASVLLRRRFPSHEHRLVYLEVATSSRVDLYYGYGLQLSHCKAR